MKIKPYIRITPDTDVLYDDAEGCCYPAEGDEIFNSDLDLGPRFSVVVAGIEEWLRRYENATDFVETTTDPSFDWTTWHYEGLCFAKAIWQQLPRNFSLYYQRPYEDNSQTIEEVEIDENIDSLIEKLRMKASCKISKISFINNVDFKVKRVDKEIRLLFQLNQYSKTEVSIPYNDLTYLRHWLKKIVAGNDPVCSLYLPAFRLYFFKQTIGSHLDMGRFRIVDSHNDEHCFTAYVNIKNFVKGVYLSLMTKLGFFIYESSKNYPTGEELIRAWTPYNNLKSRMLESFISNRTPLADDDDNFVNETFVMYPDYWSGCIFWDTMGIGSGDEKAIYADEDGEDINIDVPGLEEWNDRRVNYSDSQTFEEYWLEGWELAKEVRKRLPDRIDLYYMSYNPMKPDELRWHGDNLPNIIVPKQ